ncbi:hypothetical protein ACFPK9_12835 [Rubritalea spongiae]|uniref:DUF4175 family protein n=1 Tax=Rubritalea spongiae TaxID=430797 RepID=A0ABW5E127_9BACT
MSKPENKPENDHQLPDSLRQQLKAFRVKVWRIKILEAFLAGLFGLLFSYILVFSLDRFFPTPGIVRLLILIAGVSLFTIFAPIWINRWVFKHRRENQLAQLIAKQYPRLGDRLLGAVELQSQHDGSISPRLRDAAMAEVAKEIDARDLENALPRSWRKRWAAAVITLITISIVAWSLTPKASWNALQRWMLPLAEIERYTETKIDFSNLPQPYYVPHGEPHTINLKLTKDSNKPETARAKLGVQAWQNAHLENGDYSFELPRILKQQELELQAGDAFANIKITPLMRPSLKSLTATVHYPDYLQKEDELLDLSSGQASIVQGSKVQIQGEINRNLHSASATLRLPSQPNDLGEVTYTNTPLKTKISNERFELPPLDVEHERAIIPLRWTDEHSLYNSKPTLFTLEQIIDTPPAVYIQNIPEETYVLYDSSIQFDILAEDDFAVNVAGIEWSGEFTKASPTNPARGEIPIANGSPQSRSLTEAVEFSFPAYNITPQKLTIRAWSEDYKSDHPRSYSAPITVYVLSQDEHRELLEQRTRDTINQLEDLMRAELDLLDENKRLERHSGEELQSEELREKLRDQAQQESENAEAMQELAEQMEGIFKEANKNGGIDPNTLKKLAETSLELREMAQQKMPDIKQKLDEAQSAENTAEKAQQDVTEAVEKQSDLLQQMEETIQKASEANQQLEAGTFVNRLRKAAGDQEAIANTHIEVIQTPHSKELPILGKQFTELDPSDQRRMFELYSLQDQTGIDVRWIQEDLGHFYSRTQKEEHRDLLERMRESDIDDDFEQMLSLIERNNNVKSIYLAKDTAKQLRDWASLLEKAAQQNATGSGAGGANAQNSEDEDFEFMLKVMELIQQEQNIRARTRSLEQKRRMLESQTPPVS